MNNLADLKKIITLIVFILLLLLFEGTTGWVRKFYMQYDIIVMFIKYLLVSILVFKYKKRFTKIFITAFCLMWVVLIAYIAPPLKEIDQHPLLSVFFSFPNILSACLGVYAGYVFEIKKNKIKGAIFSFVVILLCIGFSFNNTYYYHFISHTNFCPKEKIDAQKDIYSLHDADSREIILDKHKYTVMDFWHTSCYACFEKFPAFEKLYEQYKDHPELQFYAVNKPLRSDTFDIFKRTEKYTFPSVRGSGNIAEVFDVRVYPTVVIVKDNRILHSGSVESAEKYIRKHVR